MASVHARIAEIQQRFVTKPAASPLGDAASPAGASDFAALLGEAQTGLSSGGTASNALPIGLPTGLPTGVPTGLPTGAAGTRAQAFVDEALRQTGDEYVWGSSAPIGDADPEAFDCSELVRWAAGRVGVDVPDGSWLQYLDLKEKGATIPVEQALRTPGALLFKFDEEPTPGGGRPGSAHVAISLGDGRTVEARGRKYGVGSWEAGDRFQYGAVIPGMA